MKVAMKGKGEPFYSSQEIDTSGWLSGFILPISFEYGVSDKIGVGLDLAASHFLLYQEDKIKYSRARILDLGIKVNYHLRTGRQNDFLIGLGLGVSSLSWKFNDLISTATGVASSDGLGAYFNLGVSNRYFFKKHVGVLLNVGYSGYVYPKVKAESASVPSSLKGKGVTEYKFNSELNWKLNGIQMGGGLAFKF
jgi:hypothetical protein